MSVKLIRENIEEVKYTLTEGVDGKPSNYFIEGIFMQGDVKNKNGRLYPSEVLAKEAKRYNESNIQPRRAFGELGHPEGPTINLHRVSHMITELKQDGPNFVGKAKIMETPMGKIVKNIMDEGGGLAVSTRGMGSIKKNKEGIMEVQEDFMLATAGDIVADPSAPNAFVKGIMEGREWVFDIVSGTWVESSVEELVEDVKKTINTKNLNESSLRIFQKYMKIVSKI